MRERDTSPREIARRFAAAIRFLRSEQQPPGSAKAGAWPALMIRGAHGRPDWNAFATALTARACAAVASASAGADEMCEQLGALQIAAAGFFGRCAAASPAGAYRFWPEIDRPKPGPDLDDTALVHLALRAAGVDDLDELRCLELFGPYRLPGRPRAPGAAAWSAGFPGVFGTWMDGSDPIVDACVNANVLRVLQRYGARIPGYRAAAAMLAVVVTLRALPARVAPYYRSSAMLVWLCAQLGAPSAEACPEEVALALAVTGRLRDASERHASFDGALLLQSARISRDQAPSAPAVAWIIEQQCADGGWPSMPLCWNGAGSLHWTSRSFPTALALGLLVHALREQQPC